jgi:hypothetical protein
MQHGRKLARFHGNTDKTGGAVGRPSCQSSLLSDPNAKTFCGSVAKATKNKKSKKPRDGGDGGPDVPNATKTEIKHKEGRHVGLDFYDLLIEALMGLFPHL